MIRLISTYKNKRLRELSKLSFSISNSDNTNIIKVDMDKKYQDILGFGAALTDSACYVISQLEKNIGERLMESLFSPDDMNISVCRLSVGSSDYARQLYSYDDTVDDYELKDFSIDYDRKYIIPLILKARDINPDLFLFSSTWSPPGWMKTGGDMYGGWLRDKYLETYARYYTCFLKEYERAGILIDGLTLQNETETDQLGKMPASYMHPEYEQIIIKDYLDTLLKNNDLKTKIWIMDHNFIMWKRAKWMLDDINLKEKVDGVAFHPYGGTADMMSMLHNAHPEVNLYWTEGGPGLRSDYEKSWSEWGKKFAEAMNNWCRSITAWNLALDEEGNPNIGPFKCAGMITIDSITKEVTYSGQYYAMGHFSRFVKKGANRVFSSGTVDDVYHTAFVNPNGEKVLVITNTGGDRELQIEYNGKFIKFSCPEDSISTMIWQ